MITIDNTVYCKNCFDVDLYWRDCDRHSETECFVLSCKNCDYEEYDCDDCLCEQDDPLPVAHDDGCPVWENAKNEIIERKDI